ncbi:MAG: hypothetical protein R3F56_22335 [Planctomycetota bacterium]
MVHPEHHTPAAESDETILDLLSRFFPSFAEFATFVAGLFVGAAILGVLTALGLLINGQVGIWPTF